MLPRGRGPLWFDGKSIALYKSAPIFKRGSRALCKKRLKPQTLFLVIEVSGRVPREPTESAGRKEPQENLGRKGALRLNPRVLILGHAGEQ